MCISIVTVIKNNKNRISFHWIFVPANHLIYNVLSFWEETCDQQWDLYVVYARMMMDLLKVIHKKQGYTIVDTVVSFVFWYTKHVVSNLPHVSKALVCYYYVNTDTIWKAPLNQVRKTRTFFKKILSIYQLLAFRDRGSFLSHSHSQPRRPDKERRPHVLGSQIKIDCSDVSLYLWDMARLILHQSLFGGINNFSFLFGFR